MTTRSALGRSVVVLALTLALAPAAFADLVETPANVVHAPGLNHWQFDASGLGIVGSITVADKSIAKALAKRSKSSGNLCWITFDTDSKIAATNGNFYYVSKISKCGP